LFYLCDFSYARSRRSELHTLREVSLCNSHAALRKELGWLQQASYCTALLVQTTESDTPLPVMFDLLNRLLFALPECPPQPLTVFAFEMKMLNELGQQPDLAEVRLSPGARQVLEHCRYADWAELFNLKLSTAQSSELRQFLHGFLIYHLGRIPPSRAAALGEEG
jgi:DNA repair protein RecO (recombination protein O)